MPTTTSATLAPHNNTPHTHASSGSSSSNTNTNTNTNTNRSHFTRGIMSSVKRFQGLFGAKYDEEQEYAPLRSGPLPLALDDETNSSFLEGETEEVEAPFSWVEYGIFALIGVAMLWAWNMFLAAAPYFQTRFAADAWLLDNFQSMLISVSTCTNLAAMLVLTNIQYSASYPFRINSALALNIVVFGLLTASTSVFLGAPPGIYLVFLLVMVSGSAWACGLIQNGAFAYAASFGRPEYTQAIMAGQGVAGVLPPIAQMVTVLLFPTAPPPAPDAKAQVADAIVAAGTSAFYYFLTAVVISVCTLVAFQPLTRRHDRIVENRMVAALSESMASIEEAERQARKVVSMRTLFYKLHWVALAVFSCFLVTMFFPVFTTKILSVSMPPPPTANAVGTAAAAAAGMSPQALSPLLQPGAFIPLAFFFWNLGDFLGRMSTILPVAKTIQKRPSLLFAFSLARLVFLPLYFLCNIGGRGAVVDSDLFYLFLVQLPYGLSSGWLGSTAMIIASEWVEEGEREAAGGFMGLCLVAGLTSGSFLSFSVAGA